MIDLRAGRWEDALAGLEVDAVICDPPYSERTHDGHDRAVDLAGRYESTGGAVYRRAGVNSTGEPIQRRDLSYTAWSADDVRAFVDAWAPRCRGWFVCLTDSTLWSAYRDAYEANGLTSFAPVGTLIPGMTVRLAGDGPSSWMINAMVARPKSLAKWGTLPGGYTGPPGERVHIGGKPLWLMRALIRDYSRKGDVVCDPCAGAATTLIAAALENRLAVGAEVDPATYEIARKRIAAGYTPSFDFGGP